jgi:hypothetical protein
MCKLKMRLLAVWAVTVLRAVYTVNVDFKSRM